MAKIEYVTPQSMSSRTWPQGHLMMNKSSPTAYYITNEPTTPSCVVVYVTDLATGLQTNMPCEFLVPLNKGAKIALFQE